MLIKQVSAQAKASAVVTAAMTLGLFVSPATAGERGPGHAPVQVASAVGRMPLGGRAVAPAGFLDFCRRSPAQCATPGVAGESLKDIEGRATTLYWAGVFGQAVPAVAPAATGRASRDFRYDWSRVFRDVPALRTAGRSTSPLVAPFAGRASALAADEYGSAAVDASAASAALDLTTAVSAADISAEAAARPANPVSRVMAALGESPIGPVADLASISDAVPATQRPFQVVVEDLTAEIGDAAPAVTLDKAGWARVNAINRGVNRRIRRASDIRAFGVADFWQAPTEADARGDCEDYVLAKREALIDAGVPADALSIAIVMTRWGESHAVLLLASDSGDFVLDNLTPWISRWDAVDYDWQERQAPGKVFDWVRMAS